MGVEYIYHAIADHGVMLTKAATDPLYAAGFDVSLTSWRESVRWEHHPEQWVFARDLDNMLTEHPGIDQRYCDLHKCFDVLHFLLSPERRADVVTGMDPGTVAIIGAQEIPGLGEAYGYTPPDKVRCVAEFLAGITRDSLFVETTPTQIQERCIYGSAFSGSPDTIWYWFEKLRDFYVETARHPQEGVLRVITT